MKVTNVALCPTDASVAAGRPALTPELLAASGARYSRNNEGLDSILQRIDPANFDSSVDTIFRMIDYGHQSIADMVPVAMFIDGISIWLAYYVWTLCPTGAGQESSTRYIRLSFDGLSIPEEIRELHDEEGDWRAVMRDCFSAYQQALKIWEGVAIRDPSVLRIPTTLLSDASEKAQKQVHRMVRNYALDRARYFLPVAAMTNVMLIMSARSWAQLCQYLLSHPLSEARALGQALHDEMGLTAPRMVNHARRKESLIRGIEMELRAVRGLGRESTPRFLVKGAEIHDCPSNASLFIYLPDGIKEAELALDLQHHGDRYSYIGERLRRTGVRFSWESVSFAEIRDLNRHRTGTKYCPLTPQGFYCALDELDKAEAGWGYSNELKELSELGRRASWAGYARLLEGQPGYVYWVLLGTQFLFEHFTTADKFIYEAELRTGVGAHFRYAKHLRDALQLWYERFPSTRGLILEGSAEPE